MPRKTCEINVLRMSLIGSMTPVQLHSLQDTPSMNYYQLTNYTHVSLLGKNQFGFRMGCGTREAIGVMRLLCERSLEHDNELFIMLCRLRKGCVCSKKPLSEIGRAHV